MTDSLMRNLNMQAIANLPIWLNMAAQVYAPSKVVLVGAGNGTGPLVQSLLGLKASPLHASMQAHLIEADPLALSQLAKKLDLESAWVLGHEVVLPDQTSIDADFNTYYQYSLGAESSLLSPGSLKSLWPNIQLRNKESCVNGILLSSLLPASWLMIDCLPAGQLIQDVNLDQVDVLMARVVFDEIEKAPFGSSLFELDEKLSSQGFKLFACFTERNTSLGKALWLRDSAKQLEQAITHIEQQAKELDQEKASVQQLTQSKVELQAKLEAEVQSRVQEVQTLRLEKEALEQGRERAQENLKAEINAKNSLQAKTQELEQQQVELVAKKLELEKFQEQTNQQIKELQDKLEQSRVLSEQQAKELDQEKASVQQLTQSKVELQAKLEAEVQSRVQGFELAADLQARLDDEIKVKHIVTEVHAEALKHTKDSLKEVETRLRNDMNKGLGNAVKQVESFMRIQSFLGDADSFGDFHGWPISPDIGLFLMDRMREKHYDLIIEFGSGTSTALFARTVQVLSDRALSKEKDIAGLNLPNTDIVTFEHDKLYFTKTQHLLKSRVLEQIVQLVHAPLIDWTEGDQSYLYYDCESTLKNLAVQYADRQARILVLVDGPPGSTCINARYPAVPCVFKALGRHQIDLVLDDASRPEEKQVIDLWRSFWKKRSFRISESLIASEKGIYLASSQG